jgi:hypothetical protein
VSWEPGYSFDFAVNASRSATGEVAGLVIGAEYWPDYNVRFRIQVNCLIASGNRLVLGGTFINYVDSGTNGDGTPAPYTHGLFFFEDNGVGSADLGSINLFIGFPPDYDVCAYGAFLLSVPSYFFPSLTHGNVTVESG